MHCQGLFDHAESRSTWLLFACCLLIFTILPVAVIRSASTLAGKKGQPRQFFAQLDSVQECFGPQFSASFSCETGTSACCQAASSGPRSPQSVLTDPVICQYYLGPVTRIFISLDCSFELRFRPGQIQAHFVKLNPPDRDRHCWFSPIR
jgi:hypothetical protein